MHRAHDQKFLTEKTLLLENLAGATNAQCMGNQELGYADARKRLTNLAGEPQEAAFHLGGIRTRRAWQRPIQRRCSRRTSRQGFSLLAFECIPIRDRGIVQIRGKLVERHLGTRSAVEILQCRAVVGRAAADGAGRNGDASCFVRDAFGRAIRRARRRKVANILRTIAAEYPAKP